MAVREPSRSVWLPLLLLVASLGAMFALARAADPMAPDAFSAVFETTKGPFTIRAVREWAPLGVDRLYRLLQDRYFDANAFFRVLRNDTAGTAFVAQWGVSGLPSANEAWASQQIANEDYGGTGVTPLSNTRGTISFAKEYLDDESTCCRTTELYVNYGNNSRLDAHGFRPVAYVVDGMATLDALAVTGEAVDWDTYLAQGNAYIEANFPWMDRITSTAIVLDADREEAVRAPDEFTVDVETTKGPFTFVAHRAWAPVAVDRLWELLLARFMDGNRFFRVIRPVDGPPFVAQWGVSGDPAATSYWNVHPIGNEQEGHHTFVSNTRGTIAFGSWYLPDHTTCCRSTELYVNYADNSRLDGIFWPMAEVTAGMEVLDALAVTGEVVDWDRMYGEGEAYLASVFPWFDAIERAVVTDAVAYLRPIDIPGRDKPAPLVAVVVVWSLTMFCALPAVVFSFVMMCEGR